MNLFDRLKHKLSTSIRFIALLSFIFQLIILSFIFFGVIEATVFILIFYFLLFFIGISRYIELKSKNFKEVVFNLFYLINCFPLIFIVLFFSIYVLEQKYKPKEENIDVNEIEFKVIDKNNDEMIKSPNEIKFDIKNKKLEDSIIEVKITE